MPPKRPGRQGGSTEAIARVGPTLRLKEETVSTWIRTIALSLTVLWLVGCSSGASQRQVAQDAVTAMGGAQKLMGLQTLIMSGGTGTRTKVGQAKTATGPDQIGELSNDVETLDLAGGRAAYDYDIKVGDFVQHRHEVLTKSGEGDGAKEVGVESIEGVTFATTPAGLFSWGTQNSPDWLLRRNPVNIALAAADSAPADQTAQDKEFDGKMLKAVTGKTHDGEDMELYYDPATKMLAGFEVLDTEPMLGDVKAQYILSDYKAVGDVQLPHHIKLVKGGEPFSEVTFASIVANDAKAAEAFAIPDALKAQAEVSAKEADAFPMKLVKVLVCIRRRPSAITAWWWSFRLSSLSSKRRTSARNPECWQARLPRSSRTSRSNTRQ